MTLRIWQASPWSFLEWRRDVTKRWYLYRTDGAVGPGLVYFTADAYTAPEARTKRCCSCHCSLPACVEDRFDVAVDLIGQQVSCSHSHRSFLLAVGSFENELSQ
jgi:hypothetical protein